MLPLLRDASLIAFCFRYAQQFIFWAAGLHSVSHFSNFFNTGWLIWHPQHTDLKGNTEWSVSYRHPQMVGFVSVCRIPEVFHFFIIWLSVLSAWKPLPQTKAFEKLPICLTNTSLHVCYYLVIISDNADASVAPNKDELEARTRRCWEQGMSDVAIVQHLTHFYDTERYGLGCGFIPLLRNVDLKEYIF